MPKSVDSNIYGADNTSFAEGIASDALTTGLGPEDYWGSREDLRSQSEANVGKESMGDGPTNRETPMISKNRDMESLNGLKTGKTARGHDTGQSQFPQYDKNQGRSSGPVYTKKES